MNNSEKLASLRSEISDLSERIMANPCSSREEFNEAFRQRDINFVESKFDGMTADERAEAEGEMAWETMCGCNGDDSPYHEYLGLNSGGYGDEYEESGRGFWG